MHISRVPNRNSPPAVLLRQSYREGGKVRKRTLANLDKLPDNAIDGLRILLKGGTARNQSSIETEAKLDGIYVIRTSVEPEVLGVKETVKARRSLSQVEQAFRCYKTIDLKVRPIYHRLANRVKAHVLWKEPSRRGNFRLSASKTSLCTCDRLQLSNFYPR